MSENYQILVNKKGHQGPVGRDGNGGRGGVGGCHFKCTRSHFYQKTTPCGSSFLKICLSRDTVISQTLLNNFLNTCVSRQNSCTPSVKNAIGCELNDSQRESTKIILLDYKIEQTPIGLSYYYQSFYNTLDKFSLNKNKVF